MSLERFQRETLKDKHIELEDKERAATELKAVKPALKEKKALKVGKIKKAKKK